MGLRHCEYHALMAFNAIDMGETTVAACHIKHALAGINRPMAIVQTLPNTSHYKWLGTLKKDLNSALFDFRELCLETLKSCREDDRSFEEPGE